jgi:hypothetical protein
LMSVENKYLLKHRFKIIEKSFITNLETTHMYAFAAAGFLFAAGAYGFCGWRGGGATGC